jgi:hypothetical protein
MTAPAYAIDEFRPLFNLTIADLNAERSQLRTDLQAARKRAVELEQKLARLEALRDSAKPVRSSLRAGLVKPLEMKSPARDVSATTAEGLRNKLKSERDPRERFRMQERLNALTI